MARPLRIEHTGSFGVWYTAVSQATSRLREEMEKNRKLKKVVQEIEGELLSEE